MHTLNQDIQERDEQPPYNISRHETVALYPPERCQLQEYTFQAKGATPCSAKNGIYGQRVKNDLQIQLQEFAQGNLRLTHEITTYQHKAIDTHLAPHAKHGIKEGVAGKAPPKLMEQIRVEHVMPTKDQKHHDDAIQLQIRTSL